MRLRDARIKAKELIGEDIPASTLRRWAAEGIISPPEVATNGATGDWPEDTVAQIVATWRALHWLMRPTRSDVRAAREIALEHVTNPQVFADRSLKVIEPKRHEREAWLIPDSTGAAEVLGQGYMLGGRLQPLVVTWGATYAKALYGWPLDKAAAVGYVYEAHNGELVRLEEPRIREADMDTLAVHFERPKPNVADNGKAPTASSLPAGAVEAQ